MEKLGNLQKIDLREVWKHEALDFTQWLAEESNIDLLSEEIGIQLSEVQTEVSIGGYKVDLVALDQDSGQKVVIENQLEATDHKHLGQILTYASGYNARIAIWIVKDIREEHQNAIEWLNNNTASDLSFFLIQMELWQIEDSPYAPKFHIVVKPNDWAKTLQQNQASTRELTDTKIMQLDFWRKFKEYMGGQKSSLKLGRKARAQHWYNISFGTSEAHMALSINTKEDQIGCEVYIPRSPELYEKFLQYQEEINAQFQTPLSWMELDGKQASRIKVVSSGKLEEEEEWITYFQWLHAHAEKMKVVFGKYV